MRPPAALTASTSGRPSLAVAKRRPVPSLRGAAARPAPPRAAGPTAASPPDVAAPPPPPAPSPPTAAASTPPPVDDFATDARPIMLYDGVCGMCNAGVDAALALDGSRRALRFAALQSPAGRRLLARAGRAPDDISSVVLVNADGRAFIESEAIVEIGRVLGVPGPLAVAALALPSRGRDAAYRAVADNRYSVFGKRALRLSNDDDADPGRFLVE